MNYNKRLEKALCELFLEELKRAIRMEIRYQSFLVKHQTNIDRETYVMFLLLKGL